jgi:putative ABC transport system permease protein
MKRSLRSWLWSVPLEQEVDDELAFHREMRRREGRTPPPDPAVRGTLLTLGRKRDREMRLMQWLEEIWTDVRFAIRQMRCAPGFTVVAVLTLALGIGANSAIFALADAVILRPLPFPHADRLMTVEEWGPQQGGRSRIELLNFHEWRHQSRTFDAMAAAWVPAEGGGPVMTGLDGAAETVSAQTVTPQFFDVLGVAPIMGRTFADTDDSTDPRVIVLSEGFWKRRFGGDPAIVGRMITLDQRPHTVIGVVSDSFEFIRRSSIWRLLPLPTANASMTGRGQCGVCQFLQVVGRLKPGVSPAAAQTEMTAVANALAERNGNTGRPRRVLVTPFRDVLIGTDLRITSMLFLGVVGLVLLLCCANVANLVLARMTIRQRELAVRGALGAGRARIAAQLLTESVVLAGLGGAVGLAFAGGILAVAPRWVPDGLLPGILTLGVDAHVAIFCAGATLLVGVLFGLAPVWHVTHAPLVEAMNAEGRTSTGRGNRVRRLLVIGEIAAAVVVLCGAGLLLRTSLILESIDPGYEAARDHVVSGEVSLRGPRYSTDQAVQQFLDAVQREVEGIPGVSAAGWATTLPMGHSDLGRQSFQVAGAEASSDARPLADLQVVSASYFRTVDVPIVAGRPFTGSDRADTPPVAIVSEALARKYLAGRDPVGARIAISGQGTVEREIVGVARQVKERPDEPDDFVQLYVPSAQVPRGETRLLVRTAQGDVRELVSSIRAAIGRVDRLVPLDHIATLDDVARAGTARPRFRTTLVAAFAVLALALAMVGVSGVLAYSVRQRRREFAVRLALGATAHHIRTLVWSDAARVLAAGVATGLTGALLLGQSVSAFLFGVAPYDPITFAAATIVIALTATAAACLPAWRASRTDPAVVFRE